MSQQPEKILLSQAGLSVRSRRCLENLNFKTLGDVTTITLEQYLKCRHVGQTSANEVKQKLREHGLDFKPSPLESPAKPTTSLSNDWRSKVVTKEDLEFLLKVCKGLTKPLTLGLAIELLNKR